MDIKAKNGIMGIGGKEKKGELSFGLMCMCRVSRLKTRSQINDVKDLHVTSIISFQGAIFTSCAKCMRAERIWTAMLSEYQV